MFKKPDAWADKKVDEELRRRMEGNSTSKLGIKVGKKFVGSFRKAKRSRSNVFFERLFLEFCNGGENLFV